MEQPPDDELFSVPGVVAGIALGVVVALVWDNYFLAGAVGILAAILIGAGIRTVQK